MRREIRDTTAFHEAKHLFKDIYRPGEGRVSDIADIQLSSDASHLLFTGTLVEDLNAPCMTRICAFDLETASIRILTSGPNSDRNARISADGGTIAFLSDRDRASDFQLFLLDTRTQVLTPGPSVEGWVEYLHWSPNGSRILLGVAGHGAELSSGRGAYKSPERADGEPGWMPRVIGAAPDSLWRTAWIFDVATGALSCASKPRENIWEATWCGEERLVAVTSNDPQEGAWYSARLSLIDISTGDITTLHQPTVQIALPRVSPSGRYLAFIEGISSDREYVAGDLRLYDLQSRKCQLLEANNIDTSCIEWRSNDHLLVAGHRGLETVVAGITVGTTTNKELWKSTEFTTAGIYATVLGLANPEDFAFVCESFFQSPRVATVKAGVFHLQKAVIPDLERSEGHGNVEIVRWHAPDGLPMEGWLLQPDREPPYATILDVHEGPVLHWRPSWLGRVASAHVLLLIRRGYAVFLPNPRGSSGRGQAFAAHVVGDVGGADTGDYLSGLDHLIGSGIADPSRLGVTGLSYGGFMTCWLTTQDARFAAAISVGPATNHVTQHLLGNIPQFASLFLQDHYTNLAGKYYSRSPVLQAHKSSTPTLLVCGDLDRCTPAEEALQFHNALLENGIESFVVRYPEEGHGVLGMPAAIDFAARCVMWFERYMPASARQ